MISYVTSLGRKFFLSMVLGVTFIVGLAPLAMKLQDVLLFTLGKKMISRLRREAQREKRAPQQAWIPPGETEDFHADDFRVEKMRVYALCTKGEPYTKNIRVKFKWRAEPRPFPEEWAVIKATVLERLIAEAKARRALINDGPQVDMVSAYPDEPNTIHVEVTPTSYFPFAAMSNRLDEEVDGLAPSPVTLRHLWTGDKPIGLFDVDTLKSPAVIGTVTVVVTTDHFLLRHARSAQVHQVPAETDRRTGVHFVGEGMLPRDCDPPGTSDPRETARRALREELGLNDEEIKETKVIPTAFVFDTKRWQPVFCYLAQVPLSFGESKSQLCAARDRFEAEDFVPFRFDGDDQELCQLLLNKHDKWRISSNHASMALYAVLVWHHGRVEVSRALCKSDTSMKE